MTRRYSFDYPRIVPGRCPICTNAVVRTRKLPRFGAPVKFYPCEHIAQTARNILLCRFLVSVQGQIVGVLSGQQRDARYLWQMIYIPYLWEFHDVDDIESEANVFRIDTDDVREFPELRGKRIVRIIEQQTSIIER